MDDDNLMDMDFIDVDLNQESMHPPFLSGARVASLLNGLETANGSVEERIRQLQGVIARAGRQQRWPQERNPIEISCISSEIMVNVDAGRGLLDEISNNDEVDATGEKGKGCKRNSSHLVAKALEMDSPVKKAVKEGGSFYDCNICLDLARDPVLTCCGHLFCWTCLYQVPYIDSTSKECPVCKGEVSDSGIIPIYGDGGNEHVCETESGLKIPPRPKACRVESVRQQQVSRLLSRVPAAEAPRQIRVRLSLGHQTEQQEGGNGVVNIDTETQEGQNSEAAGSRHGRIQQVSRVLSESTASLASVSSALIDADRHIAVLESHNRPVDSAANLNAAFPITSSSESPDVSGSAVQTLRMRRSSAFNLRIARSYSLRRRSIMSRTSDVDIQDTREPRRRRLN